MYIHKSKYFYGNKISDYGIENGYIDYRTLASAFEAILNNEVIERTIEYGLEWDIYNGDLYDEEDNPYEIYQYYIITDRGAEILSEMTNEIVFYNEELDMYVWGVTHYGTSWDYVLTDIKIELEENDESVNSRLKPGARGDVIPY